MPLTGDLSEDFAAAMNRLGPFEPDPGLAVAVSGGADSMALAVLARDWVGARGGMLDALIVDHGLRADSADEARTTADRLAELGVASRILPLAGLARGPALAERARVGRYAVLMDACRKAGVLHLLLGHHAADQMETLAMRVLRGSGTHGLAGMAALRETEGIRLLRPLLGMAPDSLRRLLTAGGIGWVEDPSNQDRRALRPRLRFGFVTQGVDFGDAMAAVGQLRGREEAAVAAELAERVTIRPEGFAHVSGGRIGLEALRALIGTIGGTAYPPSAAQVAELAAAFRPATVAGVRILPAGRFGCGVLVVREAAAVAAPVPAVDGVTWDRRFRLVGAASQGAMIGALGSDAAGFRRSSTLPSAVLRTLPAIRVGEMLASVPHLGYKCREYDTRFKVLFAPARRAADAAFYPAA